MAKTKMLDWLFQIARFGYRRLLFQELITGSERTEAKSVQRRTLVVKPPLEVNSFVILMPFPAGVA
ncbi:MAG TPA: hypothetical protein VES89_00735, partial [Candidatus Competibacteraceae bacterium]|nr:hypothetical protein [Candidatus Competibacteraceae bacterium]